MLTGFITSIKITFLSVYFYHVIYAFIVNLHFVTALMSRNSLLKTGAISQSKWLQWGLNPKPLSSWMNTRLNGCVLIYKLSDCGFKLCCNHLFCCVFQKETEVDIKNAIPYCVLYNTYNNYVITVCKRKTQFHNQCKIKFCWRQTIVLKGFCFYIF